MNEIKGFSFYKSYYDCLQELKKEDRLELLNAMLDYVFKDKKPSFNGIKKTIWVLIEPNLNVSKNRSNRKSGAPVGNQNACKIKENEEKEVEEKTTKKQSKNNQKTINDIKDISLSLSLSYSLSSSLSYINSSIINNNILNKLFIEYIKLREDRNYTISETIIKRLINQLECVEDDNKKKEMIEQAIIKGWKEFYPVKENAKNNNLKKVDDGVYRI